MSVFNGDTYEDPREDVRARIQQAADIGDVYVAVPINLLIRALATETKICEATTIVNGNREKKTLVEIRCTKPLDPKTGNHFGNHENGKINW